MDSFSLGILEWPLQADLAQKDDTRLAHNYTILICFHAESNWSFFHISKNYLIQILPGEDIH